MERKLCAILAADVVGYSRLMERDEVDTFERLRAHRKDLFEPEIAAHHGRIFKLTGDGLLAEFASVVDAVECAVLLQRELSERNNGLSPDRRIDVRIGLHVGDVIIDGEDRQGDAINIAARLEQIADTGGICISSAVLGHVRHKVALRFEPRGEVHLKNIAEPVEVYRVALEQALAKKSINRWVSGKWMAFAALVLLMAAGGGYLLLQAGQQPTLPAASMAGSATEQASGSPPPKQTIASVAPSPVPAEAGSAPLDQGIPVIIVLPFQDLTGDDSPGDLGKGIAEAFITDLATFPDFEVVSSTSSFAYAGKPIPEIVKETGALFVIEGSVRRSGGKAAVTMQLIRGDTDRHLKIAQVEEPLTNPVQLQIIVAGRLRDELGGMTGVIRQEYDRIAQSKPDAERNEYDYYALGHIDMLHGRGEAAGKIWQEGLARFPRSALLHYKVMIYHLDQHNAVEPAAELWADAEKLPRRSRLDDWYRHWLSAWLHAYRYEHGPAVSEARAAIAMAPYDVVSHSGLSWVMREAGETDEAIEWAKFAVTHDPNMYNRSYFRALREAYKAARKWPEAVALGEAQIINDPVHAKWWYEFLDVAYSGAGQSEKARVAWKAGQNLPEPPEP
jgi:class 3 adenylate cyclase/TolB-like protein